MKTRTETVMKREASMTPEETQAALGRWGRQPISLAEPGVLAAREARGLATIRAAIASAHRQRRTRIVRLGFAIAAASLLTVWAGTAALRLAGRNESAGGGGKAAVATTTTSDVLGTKAARRGSAKGLLVTRRGSLVGTRDGAVEVRVGDRVETAENPGDLELGAVTSARLAPRTVLTIQTLDAAAQRVVLTRGHVDFIVDPTRHARVVVQTPDARVLVTGTAFAVAAEFSEGEAWTEVRVTRGHVQIAHDQEQVPVSAGQLWSSRQVLDPPNRLNVTRRSTAVPSARAAPLEAAKGPTQVAGRAPDLVAAQRALLNAPARPDASTTLAEENRLFRAALAARNEGDAGRCVALLDDFSLRFPTSPLRQEAVVARFRCLGTGGHASPASRAAARYLMEYPEGFAREEARDVVLNSAR